MNMVSTQLALIKERPNCNWSESTFITMKPLEESMFPELSLLTWNLELWIASEVVLLVKFSDLTTLSLDKVELEIIGPRVITLKVT